MYPIVRLAKEMILQSRAPRLSLFETHVSHHMCWPWDIDMWMELNNGRTLTLYDLGRIGMFIRLGMVRGLKKNRWAGTVAGSSVRYRRRVRMFDRFEMRSRIIGWDARFVYSEQSMWRGGDCTSHVLLRMAITGKDGLVPTETVSQVMLDGAKSPDLPAWAQAWAAADGQRPWPPEM